MLKRTQQLFLQWYVSPSCLPDLKTIFRTSFSLLQAVIEKAAVSEAAAAVRVAESASSAYSHYVDKLVNIKEFGIQDEARMRWHAAVVEFRSVLASDTLLSVITAADALSKLDAQSSVTSLGLFQVSFVSM